MNVNGPVLIAALHEAERALTSATPTPRLDAEVLLMHACNLARTALIIRASETLTIAQHDAYRRLVERRRAGEPISYITGVREFWSLPLSVTPAVLIPRPDTELLVEQTLTHIPLDRDTTVADLGTGSGAIALAIASERPRVQVVATDVDADALAVARGNARKLELTNVEFRLGDWFTPISPDTFDIIVSNPPYVHANDPHLSDGDLRHEPRAALVSGSDGLNAIRHIAAHAHKYLATGGWLLLEHGHDQADAVHAILLDAGFAALARHHDLAGQPRVTDARRDKP